MKNFLKKTFISGLARLHLLKNVEDVFRCPCREQTNGISLIMRFTFEVMDVRYKQALTHSMDTAIILCWPIFRCCC